MNKNKREWDTQADINKHGLLDLVLLIVMAAIIIGLIYARPAAFTPAPTPTSTQHPVYEDLN
jgi:hypothetical protein